MSLQSVIRRARLMSGLMLMAFVTCHLSNLALGLSSLAAVERWQPVLMGPWLSAPGKILLAGAALVHAMLGLYALAARCSLVLSASDIVQLSLGLLVPPCCRSPRAPTLAREIVRLVISSLSFRRAVRATAGDPW